MTDAAIPATLPPRRSWAEVRWRQFRHAPRPVVRAVAASLSVAIVLAILYVAYDVALSRGADLPAATSGPSPSPSTSSSSWSSAVS